MLETSLRLEGDHWIVRYDGQEIGTFRRFATAAMVLMDLLDGTSPAEIQELCAVLAEVPR